MTNDNTVKPSLEAKFAMAIEAAVGMCVDAGMHPSQMVPTLRYWTKWAEDAAEQR